MIKLIKHIGSGGIMQKVGKKNIPYGESIYCKTGHKDTMHGELLIFYKQTRSEFNEIR